MQAVHRGFSRVEPLKMRKKHFDQRWTSKEENKDLINMLSTLFTSYFTKIPLDGGSTAVSPASEES